MLRSAGSHWTRLDELDLRILKRLEFDARLQNQELAREIGLSPSGALHRVRRLEKAGVITRWLAEIDPTVFDGWVVLWGELTLSAQGRVERGAFEERVRASHLVVEARRLIGRADYLLKIVGRDAAVWTELLRQLDARGDFIQTASVQVEDAVAKAFSGLPQLQA